MIKVAICDDENMIASQIDNMILTICQKENISVDTDVFYGGSSLEKEMLSGTKYDLIYLDIQMKDGDGITIAKNIRKMDENVLLIYVSGYDRYLMDLFRLDVLTFIKKPIDTELFANTFLDAHRKIGNNRFYFVYRYKNIEYKIPCIDILYFESKGRKVILYGKSGSIGLFNGKLSDVEIQVTNGKIPYLRIHQSFLVNYHHIKSRSRTEVTLTTGTKLPISEDRQKTFGEQYNKIIGDEVHFL